MKISEERKRNSLKNIISPIFKKKSPFSGRNRNPAFAGLSEMLM
jgi:hypothetical protein